MLTVENQVRLTGDSGVLLLCSCDVFLALFKKRFCCFGYGLTAL